MGTRGEYVKERPFYKYLLPSGYLPVGKHSETFAGRLVDDIWPRWRSQSVVATIEVDISDECRSQFGLAVVSRSDPQSPHRLIVEIRIGKLWVRVSTGVTNRKHRKKNAHDANDRAYSSILVKGLFDRTWKFTGIRLSSKLMAFLVFISDDALVVPADQKSVIIVVAWSLFGSTFIE